MVPSCFLSVGASNRGGSSGYLKSCWALSASRVFWEAAWELHASMLCPEPSVGSFPLSLLFPSVTLLHSAQDPKATSKRSSWFPLRVQNENAASKGRCWCSSSSHFKHKQTPTSDPHGKGCITEDSPMCPLPAQHGLPPPQPPQVICPASPLVLGKCRNTAQVTCSYRWPLVFTLNFLFGRISNSGQSNGKGHRSKCIPQPQISGFCHPMQLQGQHVSQPQGPGHIRTLSQVPKYTQTDMGVGTQYNTVALWDT